MPASCPGSLRPFVPLSLRSFRTPFFRLGRPLILPLVLPALAGTWGVPGAAAQSLQPVGVVDRVTGGWVRVQDQQRLVRGTLLYEGDTVSADRSTAGAVEVVIFAGNRRWAQRCSETEPCGGSYRPGAGDEDAAEGRGFWAFLSSFWGDGRQLPPILAGARAASARGPVHALIRLQGDEGDLAPALQGLSGGEPGTVQGVFTLRLVPAPGGSLDESGASTEVVDRIGGDQPVVVKGLEPGLYMLSVTNASGQTVGAAALALLHPDPDGALREVWDEARRTTAAWADVDPVTRASVLAQTLYALDARAGG